MPDHRVRLPGADELFRATVARTPDVEPSDATDRASAKGSGRTRHHEKITIYISSEELMELEQARLRLKGEHGVSVDRGRIVREAIAMALTDLAERGADSELVVGLRAS